MALRRVVILGLALVASACATMEARRFSVQPVTFEQLSGWASDDHVAALNAFAAGCPLLAGRKLNPTAISRLGVPQPVWQSLCNETAITPRNEAAAKDFFERRFTPYRIAGDGLFTGYYEPLLKAARRPDARFRYPLYAPPPELATSKPYLTRQQINRGALKGRHLEMAWVDDPVMLYFLQVQGSGKLRFADGREVRIGYADKNGQPYVSLGKVMGDEGFLPKDKIDFFTIRQWLYAHPAKAGELMERNPTYVFFRWLNTPSPVGAAGAPLTPERSLAVDNDYIPYGVPLFLDSRLPQPNGSSVPFQRLLVAQDTGIAIKGAVRGDIFFGAGKMAEYYAGAMKGRGSYTLLLPKEVSP